MLRIESLLFRIIAVITALVSLSVPLMAQTTAVDDDYIKGKSDGERDAGASSAWFWAGFCLGPFGVLIAYLHKPSLATAALVGKSQSYIAGYAEGYKDRCASMQGKKALNGCMAMCLLSNFFLLVYLAVTETGFIPRADE